jgi:hypothetical protein
VKNPFIYKRAYRIWSRYALTCINALKRRNFHRIMLQKAEGKNRDCRKIK